MYVLVPLRSARVHGLLAVACMHVALQDRVRTGIADVAAGRHRGCLGLAAILQ
jgi:hypothetical protein